MHFWLNESWRMTSAVRYSHSFSSETYDDANQWMFGIGFSRLIKAYHPVEKDFAFDD